MQYRKVAKIEEELSVIGYGCWSVCGYNWTDGSTQESIRAIHAAIDMGINYFDVAPIYGYGDSEEFLGQAIKGKRDKVFLGTKCGLRWEVKDGPDRNDLSKESIMEEIDMSLKRLDIDCIDLWQMHWPDPKTPIDETMEAMYACVKAGKVRYIGGSNYSVELLEEASKIAPVVSDQILYNMFDRNSSSYHGIPLTYKSEDEILPYCEKNGMAVLPYSPLCQGVLSGRYYRGRDKDLKSTDMRLNNPELLGDKLNAKLDVVDKLKVVADEAGITLLEMAIGWLTAKPAITSIVNGIRTEEQAIASAKAGDVVLPDDVVAKLTQILDENK